MVASNGIALENMLPTRQFRIADSHIYPHASRDSIIILDARGLISGVHFLSDEGLLIPYGTLDPEEDKWNPPVDKVVDDGRKLARNDTNEPLEPTTESEPDSGAKHRR
jgi:hypothetical protein